ncbi:MAG: neutral/alkaline non-lysosomal ceramidase N-terminal domain-containing protein [Erysipelotrichaceae bacterium]|nr:neutral/alkaline non-lysosomal ceramidase N-terminal domain-containing protein [Erysipelotrichaceae bacterium]
MKTAFKKIDITPNLPVRLSGFGKVRVAEKVHDPIYARVFLFQQNTEEILWVQFDLCAIDQYLLDLIKEKTGIKEEKILLSATHTHSGPGGTLSTHEGMLKGLDPVFCHHDAKYCNWIASSISDAVCELRTQLLPVSLKLIQGKINGLATDRHDPSLEADDGVLVIELSTEQKKALIVRMACHPTVLNGDNLEMTADFPGTIEVHLKDYELCAYVNGSCGDMSTRFTRQGQGFDEAARFGKLCANTIQKLLEQNTQTFTDFSMDLTKRTLTVPARKSDSPEEAYAKLKKFTAEYEALKAQSAPETQLRLALSFVEGAQNNLLASSALQGKTTVDIPVSVLKLPNLTLIFTPAELFSKLSNPLKKYGLEFIGYTNGYHLYMPDSDAYDKQFYEASSSPYAQGAGENLMKQIKEWVL